MEKLSLIQQTGACSASVVSLIMGTEVTKPNWTKHSSVQNFQTSVKNGGKEIGGPLLVIHGDADPILNVSLTTSAVEETSSNFPTSQIEYLQLPGISHNAALTSSQRFWMDWIEKRFASVELEPGLKSLESKAAMPISVYQTECMISSPAGFPSSAHFSVRMLVSRGYQKGFLREQGLPYSFLVECTNSVILQ